nr:sigma-70 family RNA polymerase sigma factor [Paenibacillus lemnae]
MDECRDFGNAADLFREQVDRHADMVLRLALSHTGNLADAQDVCQEVLIKLCRYRQGFSSMEHEKAWLIRVTINQCQDLSRSVWSRWFAPVENVPLIDQDTEEMDVLSHVLMLPRKYRLVIHLYYYEGYKTSEIADLLDLNEATVRTQLKRAKGKLRIMIQGGFEDED